MEARRKHDQRVRAQRSTVSQVQVPAKKTRLSKLDSCPGINSASASGKRMLPLPKYFKLEGEINGCPEYDDTIAERSSMMDDSMMAPILPRDKRHLPKAFDKMSAFDTMSSFESSTLRGAYDFVDDTIRPGKKTLIAVKGCRETTNSSFLFFPVF